MKENRHIETILTALVAAVLLVVSLLCLAAQLGGHGSVYTAAGMVLSVVGAALLVALCNAYEKQRVRERELREREKETLAAEHAQQMESLRGAHRQEMESFRSTVSHTLRMPVAIIQGYAELLCGDMVKDPNARREYLEKIIQRSQYMTDVMSRQLFAEGTVDKSKLSYSEFDLLQMLRQVCTDTAAAAAEKSVHVELVSDADSIVIKADDYLLNRVFFNLLENAFKYMGRPGTVTIRAVRESERVSVTVSDDGMGLPAEDAAHVFERRFRGNMHSDMSGQGYGLHLVKQTVEAHGGRVHAECAVGQGMRIALEFPVK